MYFESCLLLQKMVNRVVLDYIWQRNVEWWLTWRFEYHTNPNGLEDKYQKEKRGPLTEGKTRHGNGPPPFDKYNMRPPPPPAPPRPKYPVGQGQTMTGNITINRNEKELPSPQPLGKFTGSTGLF